MKQLIKKILKESIKEKLQKRLEEDGLMETLNILGIDINQLSDMLNTTPMELIRKNLIDKKLNNTDFNINNGGYNFNFIITDIDEHGSSWTVYVEILDGTVDLLTDDEMRLYDLWDLWEEDFWWEIQNEIDDIIYDIIRLYKPEDIDLEIHQNLR